MKSTRRSALSVGLSIIGTAAMFLVGGGILTHGLHAVQEWILHISSKVSALPGIGGVLKVIAPFLLDALAGIVAGAVVLVVVTLARRVGSKILVQTKQRKPQ